MTDALEDARLARVESNWPIVRLKHVAQLIGGGTPSKDNEEFWTGGTVPWVSPKDMKCRVIDDTADHITEAAVVRSATSYVDAGSPLIVVRSGILRHALPVAIAGRRLTLNQDMKAFRLSNRVNNRFLAYWIEGQSAELLLEWRQFGTTVESINTTRMINGRIAIPNIRIQRDIADFLDRETARIDQLIEKKERLTILLEQKQQALVDQLVTGGLSRNQHRKVVSVPWPSAIPSHWEALPLRKILAMPITDGPHETPEFVDEGVIFISAESIKDGEIDFHRMRGYIIPEANQTYSRKYSPASGDIYIVKSGATTGNSAMVRDFIDFNIWSPLAVLRPASFINGEYLLLAIRSSSFQDAIALNWSWGTQQNIGMGTLGRIVVPVPPVGEQDWIVDHYMEKAAPIRNAVASNLQSIKLLRELRSVLITAAVTGQIDVSTWSRRGETDRRLEAIEHDLEVEREEAAV